MSNSAASHTEGKYRKVSSPYGFRMYDVEATAAMERASRAAQEIVKAQGFERIMPAMIDYPETFSESQHSEMFSLKDNSGERLALRNDITAQVIKGYVRQIKRKTGVKVRRFYYAAPVYKDVRKNYPLPREIWQVGCEIIGENADSHLVELMTLSQRILREVFGYETATQVSDVRLRNLFAELAGTEYPAAERRRDAPLLVRILTDEFSVTEAKARELALWFFYPTPEKKIPQAVTSLPDILQDAIGEAAAEAEKLIRQLAAAGINATWQPLCEPRSSYYSGLFFETYARGFTEPLVRGGVYNELVSRYAEIEAGACGFAVDLLQFS
jgi:ATP phosphoribosyltransferase regulatory subunit